MKRSVTVLFDSNQDFYHASSLYAGLESLASQGLISLSFQRAGAQERPLVQDPLTICLRIEGSDLRERQLLALGLHDRSDVFPPEVLERCDAYFKRSFHAPDVKTLPIGLASKVHPLGMNYACRTSASTSRLLRTAFLDLVRQGRAGIARTRHHFGLPALQDFEQDAGSAVESTVVFQTRVWEEHDTAPGESAVINEERVALVRALRDAFGDRFRGGLVPTPLALSRYPREVSQQPSRRSLYTAMSKRNLVGVYTRGLHHSTAFKLPEYLAASQCIVAEPPRNCVPEPLVEGKHYLAFSSPDECVRACQRVLEDARLAEEMRSANQAYYRAQVEPSARIRRLLFDGAAIRR